jgi:hypothetical protein
MSVKEECKKKCNKCGNETFQVYFNNDNLYKNVVYERCMKCNLITAHKITFEDN